MDPSFSPDISLTTSFVPGEVFCWSNTVGDDSLSLLVNAGHSEVSLHLEHDNSAIAWALSIAHYLKNMLPILVDRSFKHFLLVGIIPPIATFDLKENFAIPGEKLVDQVWLILPCKLSHFFKVIVARSRIRCQFFCDHIVQEAILTQLEPVSVGSAGFSHGSCILRMLNLVSVLIHFEFYKLLQIKKKWKIFFHWFLWGFGVLEGCLLVCSFLVRESR